MKTLEVLQGEHHLFSDLNATHIHLVGGCASNVAFEENEQIFKEGDDAKCLREKYEQDPNLGHEMMKRFAQVMLDRLNVSRLQLLDMYGRKFPNNLQVRRTVSHG
jgi:hypothetical protein